MRSIISAQSWASVPPAPAWISATASPSSYGPANSERSSRRRRRRSSSSSSLLDLGPQRVVVLLFDQLVEGLGVGELLGQAGQLLEVLVDPTRARWSPPGRGRGRPTGPGSEASFSSSVAALVEPVAAQEALGLGQALGQRRQRARDVDPLGLAGPPTGAVGGGHLSWRRGRA